MSKSYGNDVKDDETITGGSYAGSPSGSKSLYGNETVDDTAIEHTPSFQDGQKLVNGNASVSPASGLSAQSPNFVTGESGWKIDDEGNAEFQSVTVANVTTLTASDVLRASADTARTEAAGAFVKVKEIEIKYGGTVRTKFDLRQTGNTNSAGGRVYLNGVATGTSQLTGSSTATTYTEDISVSTDDLIQLYINNTGGIGVAEASNFRIYYDFTTGSPITVITD